jgi:hypothetical protein
LHPGSFAGRCKTAQFSRATLWSVEKRFARPVWAKHQIGHRLWAAHDAHQKKRIIIAVIAAQMMKTVAMRHGLADNCILNAHPPQVSAITSAASPGDDE